MLYPQQIDPMGKTPLFPSEGQKYVMFGGTTGWDALVNGIPLDQLAKLDDDSLANQIVSPRRTPVSIQLGKPKAQPPQPGPRGTTIMTYTVRFDAPPGALTAPMPGPKTFLKADIEGDEVVFRYAIAPNVQDWENKVYEVFSYEFNSLKELVQKREQQARDEASRALSTVKELIALRRTQEQSQQTTQQRMQARLDQDFS